MRKEKSRAKPTLLRRGLTTWRKPCCTANGIFSVEGGERGQLSLRSWCGSANTTDHGSHGKEDQEYGGETWHSPRNKPSPYLRLTSTSNPCVVCSLSAEVST